VRPTQVLADIDFGSAPFLLGYVVTRAKPTSEVVLATENGDPLLTWWRYGLGMSVAFSGYVVRLQPVLGTGHPQLDA
jgi:hypothetical protein